jgi:hypothetical protein
MGNVEIILNLVDGTGALVTEGSAVFTANSLVISPDDTEEIIPAPISIPLATGSPATVQLAPTDGGQVPAGWAWQVAFPGVPGNLEPFSFALPAGPASFTATHASPAVFTWTPTAALTVLPNGTGVKLSGGSLPAGFTAGTLYYVVGASGRTFQLSATVDGSAIASTGTGSGTLTVSQMYLSAVDHVITPPASASYLPEPAGTPPAGWVPTATGVGQASAWAAPAAGSAGVILVAASNAPARIANAADYLCTGTDDQVTINEAIAALPSGGGTVLLSSGVFQIAAPITITSSNVSLEGQGVGTQLQVPSGSNLNWVIALTGQYTVECKLRRFFIQGSYGDTNGHGIYISTPWGSTDTQHVLEDIYVTNCPGHGVYVPAAADTRVLLFNRVHVKNVKGSGFYFAYPSQTDSVFTDCIADTCGQHGFFCGGANNWFQNCKTFYCGSSGSLYFGFFILGYNQYFESCQAQDNYNHGFYGSNSGDATYGAFGCVFVNCSGDANGQSTPASGLVGNGVQEWQVIGGVWMTRPYETSWQQEYGITWQDAVTGPTGLRASNNNTVIGALFRNNSAGDILDTSSGVNYPLGNVSDSSASPSRLQGKLTVPSLQVTGGAAAGKVLTSDASGNGTWQVPAIPMTRVAGTAIGGYSLTNGTGQMAAWTAPNDGQNHRALIIASLHVTSAQSGGAVEVFADFPDGFNAAPPLFAGGLGVGDHSATTSCVIEPGSTVSVDQISAQTAGAAVLWCEIFGY